MDTHKDRPTGPDQEEKQELESSNLQERRLNRWTRHPGIIKAASIGTALGFTLGSITGILASARGTSAQEQPTPKEASDDSPPPPVEVTGLGTDRPKVVLSTPEQQRSSEFRDFITEQALNPNTVEKFSPEELQALEENWNRVVNHIENYYDSGLINQRVVFRKSETTTGHAIYSGYTRTIDETQQRYVDFSVRLTSPEALSEVRHHLAHVLLTGVFSTIDLNDPLERDWVDKLIEGGAQKIARETEILPSGHPSGVNEGIDWFFVPGREGIRRQYFTFGVMRDKEDREKTHYDQAAAQLIAADRRANNQLFPAIHRVYRGLNDELVDPKTRLRRQDVSLANYHLGAILDRIEVEYPGAKAILSEEGVIPPR